MELSNSKQPTHFQHSSTKLLNFAHCSALREYPYLTSSSFLNFPRTHQIVAHRNQQLLPVTLKFLATLIALSYYYSFSYQTPKQFTHVNEPTKLDVVNDFPTARLKFSNNCFTIIIVLRYERRIFSLLDHSCKEEFESHSSFWICLSENLAYVIRTFDYFIKYKYQSKLQYIIYQDTAFSTNVVNLYRYQYRNICINLKDILYMEAGQGVHEGNYYLLICKANDQALRIASSDPTQFAGSRIDCDKANQNDPRQIWLLDNINKKDDGWEIVNCLSCMVMDEEKQQIKLNSGKQKSDQLFSFKPAASLQFQYFYILTDVKGNKALEFEGCLRNKPFQNNRDTQMFRFQPINMIQNQFVGKSALIINKASGKAIDIPGASSKKGIEINQWEKNNRFNQRWRFVPTGKGVMIQSLFNNQCLDVEGAKSKSGIPIVQWEKSGDPNQVWIPTKVGDRLYTFKSAMDSSLFLSVDKESIKDGARLETYDKDSNSNVWEVVGCQP